MVTIGEFFEHLPADIRQNLLDEPLGIARQRLTAFRTRLNRVRDVSPAESRGRLDEWYARRQAAMLQAMANRINLNLPMLGVDDLVTFLGERLGKV